MTDGYDRPAPQGDPLAAIRDSLVAAATRRQRGHRRRRRALATTAATFGVFAATGVAFAVTGTPTGVTALDRWLDVVSERSPQMAPESRVDGEGHPAPLPDVAPAGDMSPPVDLPLGDGVTWPGVGYVTRRGSICGALADPDTAPSAPRGSLGCVGDRLLRRALAHQPAWLIGGGGHDAGSDGKEPLAIYEGVARDDVIAITMAMPGGKAVDAVFSKPWEPRGWAGSPLRVFFGVLPLPSDLGRSMLRVRVHARLADGRVVDVTP